MNTTRYEKFRALAAEALATQDTDALRMALGHTPDALTDDADVQKMQTLLTGRKRTKHGRYLLPMTWKQADDLINTAAGPFSCLNFVLKHRTVVTMGPRGGACVPSKFDGYSKLKFRSQR